jgi:hypothetical protein
MGGGILNAVTIQGSSPTIYSTTYSQFKGVDFSTDPMLVDKSRSPYAVNLISDSGGMPEKRPGWRTLHKLEGAINGLWHCFINDTNHYLVHAGNKIYKWTEAEEPTLLLELEGEYTERSCAFFLKSKLFILTGKEYLQYDGETVKAVEAYVPTVVINRLPTGGGDFLESYNIIGDEWVEEFIGNGTAKEYKLTKRGEDEGVDAVTKVEVYETDKWVTKTDGYTVDTEKGVVNFTTAPADQTIPNVKITVKKAAKNKDKIYKGKSAAIYNDAVVFVAGAERGADYRSGFNRPDYFPEDGYDQVGANDTDIMGYCKIGEYLGIIKESNSQDSTIFLRWHEYQTDSNGEQKTVYRKKQGVVGVGAISRHAIGMLLDEPLFLSRQGIFALTSNAVTFERTVQNRSEYLDFKLTREEGLENAVCCEWNTYFLVAVNGHCYLLDSKQPASKSRNNSSFVYEGYYWENIPATVFLSIAGELYFGTEDGRICRFNTDVDGIYKYNDDGKAIKAIWSTMADDDGHPQRLKTMTKKGCAVTIKPFNRSSAKISIRTEKDPVERLIREDTMDIFHWEDIDFDRFSFNSNDAPQDIMLKRKEKKYKRLQFHVMNDRVNEGFGVFQITKSYKVLGLAKR